MQLFLADGCKEALLEEKRRFCFLVDKHCMFSYQTASFHDKVRSIRGILSSALAFLWVRRRRLYIENLTLFDAPAGTFYSAASGVTSYCVTMVMENFELSWDALLFCLQCRLCRNRPETFWWQSWAAGRTSAPTPPKCPTASWRWLRGCAPPSPSHRCPLPPRRATVWYEDGSITFTWIYQFETLPFLSCTQTISAPPVPPLKAQTSPLVNLFNQDNSTYTPINKGIKAVLSICFDKFRVLSLFHV